MHTIEPSGLDQLLTALRARGYEVLGPALRDGAIGYGPVTTMADLPRGWSDEQEGGCYRLRQRDDAALFAYNVGPQAWKQFLQPPVAVLWWSRRDGDGFELLPEAQATPRYAFVGVRACDLAAIRIQDRVYTGGPYTDPGYQARRERAFIVAVNCGSAGNTCFCTSMGTGPRAVAGFDLALTEVLEGGRHFLVAEPGSPAGEEVLAAVPHRPANQAEQAAVGRIEAATAASMGRSMETEDVPALLMRNLESPQWDEIASRCLTCANCTMVCPTCFCTTVEDTTDVTGNHAERWRKWDSCFTTDFSYLHGGSVRASGRSRYRQWLTHKLATWHDQFGTSGCVGCGRCITWCPVGIDLTAEVRKFRDRERAVSQEEPKHAEVSL